MFIVPTARRSYIAQPSFERFFDDALAALGGASNASDDARQPALDVSESDSTYTVTLDMPGVAKDDIKVSIDDKLVTISAEAKATETASEGVRVVHRERRAANFSRRFSLRESIDQTASSAKLELGVLTLVLTKKQPPAAASLTIN